MIVRDYRLGLLGMCLLVLGCGGTADDADAAPPCPGTQVECGGGCYDLMRSSEHCGDCDSSCGAGEACVSGTCELACGGDTPTMCGDACVDTDTNRDHCGGCAGAGGTACAAGEVCSDGGCGLSCGGATPTLCAGSCVDTATNDDHCGGCAGDGGVACAAGEDCVDSGCVPSCGAGLTACGSTCTDTDYDPANCGGCAGAGGVACATDEACSVGECVRLGPTCDRFATADSTTVPGWTEVTGDFFIDTERLMTTASTGFYTNHATMDGSDQTDGCVALSAEYGPGDNLKSVGVVSRWQAADQYIVSVIQDNSSSGEFDSMWIYEYPGPTQIGNMSGVSLGTDPNMEVEVIGTTVTLRVDVDRDGTFDQELTATTTITAGGPVGYMGLAFGSPAFIDNFCLACAP